MKHSDRIAHLTEISAIAANLTALPSLLERAYSDWNARGYPSGGGDGTGSRTSDTTSTTERAALQEHDEIGARLANADADIVAAWSAMRALAGHNAYLSASKRPDPNSVRPTTSCCDCGRTVANTPADRLRSGRCNACRMARIRSAARRSDEGVVSA